MTSAPVCLSVSAIPNYLLFLLSINPSLFTLYLSFSPYLALSYLLILSIFPFLPSHYLLSCPSFSSCLHFKSHPVQLSLPASLHVFLSLSGLNLSSNPVYLPLPASTLSLILSSFPCLPQLYFSSCSAVPVCLHFIYFTCLLLLFMPASILYT